MQKKCLKFVPLSLFFKIKLLKKIHRYNQVVVAHASNHSTGEADADRYLSVSLRPAWSTEF